MTRMFHTRSRCLCHQCIPIYACCICIAPPLCEAYYLISTSSSHIWPGGSCSLVGIGNFSWWWFSQRFFVHTITLVKWRGCDSGWTVGDGGCPQLVYCVQSYLQLFCGHRMEQCRPGCASCPNSWALRQPVMHLQLINFLCMGWSFTYRAYSAAE